MNILDYYIGARDKLISIEKAEAEDMLVEWKCKQGHIFETTANLVESVINNGYCPCCRKLEGLEEDAVARDCTEPDSLFSMDCELFDGQISKRYIHSGNNYINTIKYNSLNGMDWNIGGKIINMSPASMVKRISQDNQVKLRDIYDKQQKYGRLFEIIRCESCSMFQPRYKADRKLKSERCLLCGELLHNPFSFGRWLDDHRKIKSKLHELVSEKEFKRLIILNRNDTNTQIILQTELGIRKTTIFDITHGNFKLD